MKILKYTICIFIISMTHCVKQTQSDNSAALALVLLNENKQASASDASCTTTANGSSFITIAKATSYSTWTHCSLAAGGSLVSETESWDIRFQRFKVATNSGVSGSRSGGACAAGTTNFSASLSSGSCTSVVDTTLSQEGGGSGGSGSVTWAGSQPMMNWYSYNETILTAKSDVYILRGSDGTTFYKVQFLDYYSSAGTSGYIKFQWSKL